MICLIYFITLQKKGDGEGFGRFEVDCHFVGRTGGKELNLQIDSIINFFFLLQTAREREERLEKQYEEFMKSDDSQKEVKDLTFFHC